MKSLTLIQLGDIHFPEHKAVRIGDIKDRAAPAAVVDAVAPSRLELVMRKIADLAQQQKAAGLLVCGDLTSSGNTAEYDSCVKYLNKSLQIGDHTRWPDHSIHVVPGNHDINRKLCDPAGINLFDKFQPLATSWESVGRNSLLSINSVRSTSLPPTDSSIILYSLNSCVGCGEQRHLPEKIREQIKSAFASYLTTANPEDAFQLMGEQLDTPAFMDAHIREIKEAVMQLASTSIPVILAHHNALPQAIPRLEIYTELINGGLFRSELASCRRPIVYCHGHIHDDPIEQIRNWRYPTSNLIFISAPLLVDGFNTITIQFSRSDIPLGLIIDKHRCTNHGSIDITEQIFIPLTPPSDLSRFRDDKLNALMSACTDNYKRFNELRESITNTLGTRPNTNSLRDLLLEAEWLSLITITDRHLEQIHWKVRRNSP